MKRLSPADLIAAVAAFGMTQAAPGAVDVMIPGRPQPEGQPSYRPRKAKRRPDPDRPPITVTRRVGFELDAATGNAKAVREVVKQW